MNEQDPSVPVAPEWCFDDTLAVESYTELLEDSEYGWRAIRVTPLGYVEMRGQRFEKGGGSTTFFFIWNGQMHRRTLTRLYHHAAAGTLAEALCSTGSRCHWRWRSSGWPSDARCSCAGRMQGW